MSNGYYTALLEADRISEGLDDFDFSRISLRTPPRIPGATAKALEAAFESIDRFPVSTIWSAMQNPLNDPEPAFECEHCRDTRLAMPDCETCEGNGWVDDPKDGGTMTCPDCDGEPCPHCAVPDDVNSAL